MTFDGPKVEVWLSSKEDSSSGEKQFVKEPTSFVMVFIDNLSDT